jgi:Mg2+ and Co2+ transporter CorA
MTELAEPDGTSFTDLAAGAVITPPGGTAWIDAVDADDEELAAVARALRCSAKVMRWLHDTDRPHRPHQVDDALTFVLAVPPADAGTADAGTGGAVGADPEVLVVVNRRGLLTAHDRRVTPTIDALADDLRNGDPESDPRAAILGLIDDVVARYETVVDRLVAEQAARGTEELKLARGLESPTDIVAASLDLATSVDDVLSRLRPLRQAMTGLRRIVSSDDAPQSVARDLEISEQAIEALEAELGDLSHRLEVMTDIRLSLQSSRQSDINKAIGAWGGVFAVNAVITGFYGMNISHLPGAGSWVTVAIIMVTASVLLIALFRRIDWL